MSRPGRRLSAEEAELWARVATSVTPLRDPSRRREADAVKESGEAGSASSKTDKPAPPLRASPPPVSRSGIAAPRAGEDARTHGLDGSWERRLARGLVDPDFTLDLHGCTLDAAHARLLHGLAQARAMGARLVLLVTGKPRPAEAAERGQRRGAIRAKVVDWLAASEHASGIAAIRGAHRRHGGPGALYIVLRRKR